MLSQPQFWLITAALAGQHRDSLPNELLVAVSPCRALQTQEVFVFNEEVITYPALQIHSELNKVAVLTDKADPQLVFNKQTNTLVTSDTASA